MDNDDLQFILNVALSSIRQRGRFVVALSGGSAMEVFGRAFRGIQGIDWQKWCFFWVDERCVPLTDHRSNYYLAKKELFDVAGIDSGNIYPVDDSLAPHASATAYQAEIESFFDMPEPQTPRFDLVVLGIGEDGHTASLFPSSLLLDCTDRLVAQVTHSPKPPAERITFTMPLINNARNVVFIAAKGQKNEIVERVTNLTEPIKDLPASLVTPKNGTLRWILSG